MPHQLLITLLCLLSYSACYSASTRDYFLNLQADQPALYDLLDNGFDFMPDSSAKKETKMIIVDKADPAQGMRYQIHILALRKGDDKKTLFDIILNYIEVGYNKAGKPAFPPDSVRSIPRIESVTISQHARKNG